MKLAEIMLLIDQIEFSIGEANTSEMYDLVDIFKELEDERVIIPHIFEFFEQHSEDDLGTPGPFVHFIEESRDYYGLLKESVQRKPTDHTLWMVNRIINDLSDCTEKDDWISLLECTLENKNANKYVKEKAQEYIEFQKE